MTAMEIDVLQQLLASRSSPLKETCEVGAWISIRPTFFAPKGRYWQFQDDVRLLRVVAEHVLNESLAPFRRKVILSSGHLLLGATKDEHRLDWYLASPVEGYSPHVVSKLAADLLGPRERASIPYGGDRWVRSDELRTTSKADRRSLVDMKVVEGIETFRREVHGDRPEFMSLIGSSRIFDFSCTRYIGFQLRAGEIQVYP